MMDDYDCGAVIGIIGKGNHVLRENLLQYHFIHHKPHMS
jgi:hypothetical protein